ncbi:MAG: hypothetical protein M3Q48_09150 [Actinomycetota bacterium]|nr:hypothetical protein [Actinomycetota bacterium]
MITAELDVTEDQLPDAVEALLGCIEKAVPAGVAGRRGSTPRRPTPNDE